MTATQIPLVDTHCHLNLADFRGDLELVIERAREAGIAKMLVPGTDLETSRRAVCLAEQYPAVYAAVGFHPHDAKEWNPDAHSELRSLADHPQVVAIGEIGLDFYRNLSQPKDQKIAFINQLELAAEMQLPVVVHNRDATEDVLSILSDWVPGVPEALKDRAGVLHAFSGDERAASNAIEKGFYIGIAGPITFRKSEDLRSLVGRLPMECLLTETDAPYLTPDPHRGERNEPRNVLFVAEAIAASRQLEAELAKRQTVVNARALFQWNHETSNNDIL